MHECAVRGVMMVDIANIDSLYSWSCHGYLPAIMHMHNGQRFKFFNNGSRDRQECGQG